MIDFKDIELEDKPIIDHYFSIKPYENSEYTFTNIFIWRHDYNFKYSIIDENLCIIGKLKENQPILFAPVPKKESISSKAMLKLVEYFNANGFRFVMKAITEDVKKHIEVNLPDMFIFELDRDNADYIYSSSDLINLKGNKFQQKRNHINKFLRNYQYSYEPISRDNIEECMKAETEWLIKKGVSDELKMERRAISEAFKNFDALGLTGGAIRINEKIQAFSIGELLNPDMAVIHIEKANIDYKGAFNVINKLFAKESWNKVSFINREEDMGIPGLRKSKISYHPAKLVEKYTAYLKA